MLNFILGAVFGPCVVMALCIWAEFDGEDRGMWWYVAVAAACVMLAAW